MCLLRCGATKSPCMCLSPRHTRQLVKCKKIKVQQGARLCTLPANPPCLAANRCRLQSPLSAALTRTLHIFCQRVRVRVMHFGCRSTESICLVALSPGDRRREQLCRPAGVRGRNCCIMSLSWHSGGRIDVFSDKRFALQSEQLTSRCICFFTLAKAIIPVPKRDFQLLLAPNI
jgi:hypothetical protein